MCSFRESEICQKVRDIKWLSSELCHITHYSCYEFDQKSLLLEYELKMNGLALLLHAVSVNLKIIRILSKDHAPWRYFVNFLP